MSSIMAIRVSYFPIHWLLTKFVVTHMGNRKFIVMSKFRLLYFQIACYSLISKFEITVAYLVRPVFNDSRAFLNKSVCCSVALVWIEGVIQIYTMQFDNFSALVNETLYIAWRCLIRINVICRLKALRIRVNLRVKIRLYKKAKYRKWEVMFCCVARIVKCTITCSSQSHTLAYTKLCPCCYRGTSTNVVEISKNL